MYIFAISSDTSKEKKMRINNKGKVVKLVPKEHASQPVRLPLLEVILYTATWTAAALYSLYAVFELSTGKFTIDIMTKAVHFKN